MFFQPIKMNCLVVVAHPDDEVLGAGATMYRLAEAGHSVNVCILSGDVTVRKHRPASDELDEDIREALDVLGVDKVIKGGFPNIEFNTVPHLRLVQFIEAAVLETNAEVIFTHHPADINNDHLHTSLACQTAARLFQRRPDVAPLRELLFMEVPSATEWSLSAATSTFAPNTFVQVGEEGVSRKIEALSRYRGVMRDYPHPRSSEMLRALATHRGSQAGMTYAESFQSVFRRGL